MIKCARCLTNFEGFVLGDFKVKCFRSFGEGAAFGDFGFERCFQALAIFVEEAAFFFGSVVGSDSCFDRFEGWNLWRDTTYVD